jgi:pimeloyl-ACP methyl ester carboxylesterase
MTDTPIFILHGLGSRTFSLLPLELYLNYIGFKNTHTLYYPVDDMEFDETLEYVDIEMQKITNKKEPVILIGQSMGGVVSNQLHKKGWNIQQAVYIGSPLRGAKFINQLGSVIPESMKKILFKKGHHFLKDDEKLKEYIVEPPHKYNTISMGWFFTDFDGCVYKRETILNEDNHIHLPWSDHRTVFANPILWWIVGKIIAS